MSSQTPIDGRTLASWREHLRDEADAAFLYRTLAELEVKPKRKEVYGRLAEVEDRHTGLWRDLLARHGVEVEQVAPSRRVRLLARIGRRLGPSARLPMLVRQEGREVKGYIESGQGTGRIRHSLPPGSSAPPSIRATRTPSASVQ